MNSNQKYFSPTCFRLPSLQFFWVSFFILMASSQLAANPKPAEPATIQAQQAVLTSLPFHDRRSYDDARRGFIAALPNGTVLDAQGNTAWSLEPFAFINESDAPPSVNPSLWRQAQLNNIHGLFEVVEGIYQIRGMDLGNMTIIEGDTGLIIIDPLYSPLTSNAALTLYRTHRAGGAAKPVVAVLYSHTHTDHFGGVRGVVSDADIAADRVRIIAPEGFMAHAIAENVIAGNAMARRANYQFGTLLPRGALAHVDSGLGKGLPRAPVSLIPPTEIVSSNATLMVDGVEIEFHMANGTEADSEFMFFLPQFGVLNTAEVTSQQMHNVYTIRGASVRDAALWSRRIDEVLERFGERTDILIAQHHWPVWTKEDTRHFLEVQRDMYKFIHDQSVRLLNLGYLPGDIAETLQMPSTLDQEWAARGYYGTLRHNSRAIYQRYMGWYDANPANLNPLPPREHARKTIEYMGGVEQVVARARDDFSAGQYRWVASVMREAVYAYPEYQAARELGADALEQLGYQAEAGTWRGAYLLGAQELRNGPPSSGTAPAMRADLLQALETGMFFDLISVRINGPAADGKHIVLNWRFTDTLENYRVTLKNAALTWLPEVQAANADATIVLTRATLNSTLTGASNFPAEIASGAIQIQGAAARFIEFLQLIEEPQANFPVVEPR